mmetsp:Transcript_5005/g.11720  ORF Transcript_5005/g.11720 Transcript_5005/m.11720 type:complete len:265 (-) Transcript_5005:647-1441(-)
MSARRDQELLLRLVPTADGTVTHNDALELIKINLAVFVNVHFLEQRVQLGLVANVQQVLLDEGTQLLLGQCTRSVRVKIVKQTANRLPIHKGFVFQEAGNESLVADLLSVRVNKSAENILHLRFSNAHGIEQSSCLIHLQCARMILVRSLECIIQFAALRQIEAFHELHHHRFLSCILLPHSCQRLNDIIIDDILLYTLEPIMFECHLHLEPGASVLVQHPFQQVAQLRLSDALKWGSHAQNIFTNKRESIVSLVHVLQNSVCE